MGIQEDFIREVQAHEFSDLIHYRVTQPLIMTNAMVAAILTSPVALDRPLTTEEGVFLGQLVTKLTNGDFTARDFEGASRLLQSQWITDEEFRMLLGLPSGLSP